MQHYNLKLNMIQHQQNKKKFATAERQHMHIHRNNAIPHSENRNAYPEI